MGPFGTVKLVFSFIRSPYSELEQNIRLKTFLFQWFDYFLATAYLLHLQHSFDDENVSFS